MNHAIGIILLTLSIFFAAVYDSHEGAKNKIFHAMEYLGLITGTLIAGWWSIFYFIFIRALIFDWIFYYYDGRPLTWKYWLRNNWIIKIIYGE